MGPKRAAMWGNDIKKTMPFVSDTQEFFETKNVFFLFLVLDFDAVGQG